jgi:hypothetical protein
LLRRHGKQTLRQGSTAKSHSTHWRSTRYQDPRSYTVKLTSSALILTLGQDWDAAASLRISCSSLRDLPIINGNLIRLTVKLTQVTPAQPSQFRVPAERVFPSSQATPAANRSRKTKKRYNRHKNCHACGPHTDTFFQQ